LKEIEEGYNSYKFFEVIAKLEDFISNDLSRKYIQIIRDRSEEAYSVLNEIRINLLKILSPVIPFFCEKIWQDLKKERIVQEESVHLSEFPKTNFKKINKKLEENMNIVFEIIEKGLAARSELKIGLKWPLITAYIKCSYLDDNLIHIIKNQLNVKNIDFEKSKTEEIEVELNTELTPELEAEGYARELSRKIQSARKKTGFVKSDKIILSLNIGDIKLEKQLDFIKERVNAAEIDFNKEMKFMERTEIKGKKIIFGFEKL
jgi:isoleucyl-tRNA synthetase